MEPTEKAILQIVKFIVTVGYLIILVVGVVSGNSTPVYVQASFCAILAALNFTVDAKIWGWIWTILCLVNILSLGSR